MEIVEGRVNSMVVANNGWKSMNKILSNSKELMELFHHEFETTSKAKFNSRIFQHLWGPNE